jgi:hypothetical protein
MGCIDFYKLSDSLRWELHNLDIHSIADEIVHDNNNI